MSCEGKDLNILTQLELAQAYRYHIWDLYHRQSDVDIGYQWEQMRKGRRDEALKIQRIYLKRFGKEMFAELATDVVMQFRREIRENEQR